MGKMPADGVDEFDGAPDYLDTLPNFGQIDRLPESLVNSYHCPTRVDGSDYKVSRRPNVYQARNKTEILETYEKTRTRLGVCTVRCFTTRWEK